MVWALSYKLLTNAKAAGPMLSYLQCSKSLSKARDMHMYL